MESIEGTFAGNNEDPKEPENDDGSPKNESETPENGDGDSNTGVEMEIVHESVRGGPLGVND